MYFDAFRNDTSITSFSMPDGAKLVNRQNHTEVKNLSLDGCKRLSRVTIPQSALYVNLAGTAITDINVPSWLIDISCSKCHSLTSANLSNANDCVYYFSNCTSLTSVSLPTNRKRIPDFAFSGCESLTGVSIPMCVTYIGFKAFAGCSSLASINIPGSVTQIGSCAFAGCSSLASLTISEGVTYIGSYAFQVCSSLRSLTIPETVEKISDGAFSGCKLEELRWYAKHCEREIVYDYKESRGTIDPYLNIPFLPGSIESVVVGKNVEYIGQYIFPYIFDGVQHSKLTWNAINCIENPIELFYDLEQVIIGNEVQVIPKYFVCDSKITEVTIPNSVISIGHGAFAGCGELTEVTIPESVTSIQSYAFNGCSKLNSLRLNAKNIMYTDDDYHSAHAFYYCENLSHIIIGDEVESISGIGYNGGLFNIENSDNYVNVNIQTVTCYAIVPPVITTNCFSQKTYENAVLEVPEGSLEAYRNAEGWKNFFKCIAIEDIPGGENDKLRGDVDGDGLVGISDVTTLIDYLLNGSVTPFNLDNADCDEDSMVSISDVTALIDYLLTGTW